MVAKRDCHMWTCPFMPAGKKEPGRAAGVATSVLGTDMSHRAGPALGAAPTAPSAADTIVVMQLGEYWDCGRHRSKKGLLIAKPAGSGSTLKDAQEIDLLTGELD